MGPRPAAVSVFAIYEGAWWFRRFAPEEPHALILEGDSLWRADGR